MSDKLTIFLDPDPKPVNVAELQQKFSRLEEQLKLERQRAEQLQQQLAASNPPEPPSGTAPPRPPSSPSARPPALPRTGPPVPAPTPTPTPVQAPAPPQSSGPVSNELTGQARQGDDNSGVTIVNDIDNIDNDIDTNHPRQPEVRRRHDDLAHQLQREREMRERRHVERQQLENRRQQERDREELEQQRREHDQGGEQLERQQQQQQHHVQVNLVTCFNHNTFILSNCFRALKQIPLDIFSQLFQLFHLLHH